MKTAVVLLFLQCVVIALPAFSAGRSPEVQCPNVLLILTDDQGWGQMSNMGHPYLRTPNMDRLKSESVSFSNFLVAPVCAPTRAALMTGRSNYRTGVTDTYQSRVNMWPDEKTVAEYLQDAGYATGLFGKWHLGYNVPLRACDQGFDHYAVWAEMQHSRQRPQIEEDGQFATYSKFLTEVFCEKAIDYISANKEHPFFCFYPLYLPHGHPDNLQVPEKYTKRFLAFPELNQKAREVFGMIEKADEEIGRLLAAVDEDGLRENTIVVFMSDNGPAPLRKGQKNLDINGGLRGNKGSVYEGGMRVPFFVRWPGRLHAGTEVDRMATVNDLLPTLLDLCGIRSEEWIKPIDGESLLPLLKDPGTTDWKTDRTFCMHFWRNGPESIRTNMWKNGCVRGEQYKLVNGDELYDLKADPNEKKNLAAKMPDRVKGMRALYKKWFESVSAERNLQSAPRAIGDPRQLTTYLYFFDKDQEVKPSGWPVEVVAGGRYTICLENLRHDMFGADVECVLRCGDLTVRKPVDSKNVDLVFEGVPLPVGTHMLQLDFEGNILEKKWRYNLSDLGHRLVWIRKEETP